MSDLRVFSIAGLAVSLWLGLSQGSANAQYFGDYGEHRYHSSGGYGPYGGEGGYRRRRESPEGEYGPSRRYGPHPRYGDDDRPAHWRAPFPVIVDTPPESYRERAPDEPSEDRDYERRPRRQAPKPVVAPPSLKADEGSDGPARTYRAPTPPIVVQQPRLAPPPVVARPAPQPTVLAARPPANLRPPPPPAIARARLPAAGETRYRESEVLVEIPYAAPEAQIRDIESRHRLIEVEAARIDLLGLSLRRWRIADARTAAAVVGELNGEAALARAQPNYLFAPADDPPSAPGSPAHDTPRVEGSSSPQAPSTPAVQATLSLDQYALVKMRVSPGLEDAAATPIRVAVIDTAIDDRHPDIAGAIEQSFDAIGDGSPVRSREHGTAMAGGIAAKGRLRGVATRVKILSARAFDTNGDGGALGDGFSIVKALDWSAKMNAQIVNMSFAGPNDPTLHDALAAANARGLTLIGAAGNAGPSAPPQYPGADDSVIAATATDADDKLYPSANVGAYVAISAPGVDVLLPAPDGGYAMQTGTSVSSALVAGVVALMLERKPNLAPRDIRTRLTATASPLGGAQRAHEFGAGLVDAAKAAGP